MSLWFEITVVMLLALIVVQLYLWLYSIDHKLGIAIIEISCLNRSSLKG